MSDEEAVFAAQVWELAAIRGVSGPPAVRAAYRPVLDAMGRGGVNPELAASLLEEHTRVAIDLFGVLADSLQLVSDALRTTVRVLDGEKTDPVTVGYELAKQKAGLAVLQDQMAGLAPFAGIGEGWDRAATAKARAQAEAERDGFLNDIQGISASSRAKP